MEARAVKPFRDKVEGVIRKKGDTFTVTEKRLEEINSTPFGALVEAVAEETAKPKASKKPKKG